MANRKTWCNNSSQQYSIYVSQHPRQGVPRTTPCTTPFCSSNKDQRSTAATHVLLFPLFSADHEGSWVSSLLLALCKYVVMLDFKYLRSRSFLTIRKPGGRCVSFLYRHRPAAYLIRARFKANKGSMACNE